MARQIYDPTGLGIGGADVDSVSVINGTHLPEPSAAVVLPLLGMASATRRR